MKCIEQLPTETNQPRLVPVFKKTERTLLSVFMRTLELVPEMRVRFLEECGYGAGRSAKYRSFMEPTYPNSNHSDIRPDGLIACERGKSNWAAFIEAKADKSSIRPDQIIDYAQLAVEMNVDAVISISNEFARNSHEPPYNIPKSKSRKRSIFHFAWAELQGLLSDALQVKQLSDQERGILEDCIYFFGTKNSGVLNYDSMPKEWPDFVQSSGIGVGFSSKTPGITEIVHGWHQERRDLRSKLSSELKCPTELKHFLGQKAQMHEVLVHDRKLLADEYQLLAEFRFQSRKSVLTVLAELQDRKVTASLTVPPPPDKAARATVNWAAKSTLELSTAKTSIHFGWKGRGREKWAMLSDFRENPEIVLGDNRDAPKFVRLIRQIHDVRRFKSRKGFVEDVEALTLRTAMDCQGIGWI